MIHGIGKTALVFSAFAVTLALGAQDASAGYCTSASAGDWDMPTTWGTPGTVPTISDDVTVNKAVTAQAGAASKANILYVNSAGSMTVALLATLTITGQTTMGYYSVGTIDNRGTFESAGLGIYGLGTFINGPGSTLTIGSTGLSVVRGGTLSLAINSSVSVSTLDPQAPDPDDNPAAPPSVLKLTGRATECTLISYDSLKGTSLVFGTVYYNDALVTDPTSGGIGDYKLVYGANALSLVAVPEPMTIGILGLATAFLLVRRRRA